MGYVVQEFWKYKAVAVPARVSCSASRLANKIDGWMSRRPASAVYRFHKGARREPRRHVLPSENVSG